MIRSRLLAAALAASMLPLAWAAAPATAAVTGDLALVQQHLRSVQSMTADFTQIDRSGKVLTGKLTLKKPGRIRFQYQPGVPYLLVSDGKGLWFLDYSVGQKQRWPIAKSPLSVLLDPDSDISRYAHVVPGDDPRVVSVEASDPRRPDFGKISMIFVRSASAPGGLMLQGWVSLDAQNNRTTVKLTNQQFNVPVSDRTFQFNDPQRGGGRK